MGGKTWAAALYIRLSREDKTEDESLSVRNQRAILLEYLENELKDSCTLHDIYIDDGLSGTDDLRPDFRRMTGDIISGRVNCVICKNLSRAFRNYADQGFYLESFFPMHGVRFITIGEPKIDTFKQPDSLSGLEIPITGIMNDRYAEKTSRDVRRTFDIKRRQGRHIGSFAPYGYEKSETERGLLEIDDDAAQTVRRIFNMYVNGGMGCDGIAKRLNADGVPNPMLYKKLKGKNYKNPSSSENDGLWCGSTVSRIIKNPVYIGKMVQGKTRVLSYKIHKCVSVPKDEWYVAEDTHDAIIDKAMFEKAEKIAGLRRKRLSSGKISPFAGILKCAHCNKAMTRKSAGGYVYYVCSTHARKSPISCRGASVREQTLLSVFETALRREIEKCDRKYIENAVKTALSSRKARIWGAEEEKNALEKLIDAKADAYIDYKSAVIDREQYMKAAAKLDERISAAKRRIAAMDGRTQKKESVKEKIDAFFAKDAAPEGNAALMHTLIDRAQASYDGDISIFFSFSEGINP